MYQQYMSIYQILSTFKVHEIIIYLRKSRSENGESVEEVLERHEKMLQEYAIRIFGEEIPEENIYREVVSGETIADRIEIQNVFERINDKYETIKGVLCIEAQRLSRGDMEDCGFLMKNFKLSNTLIITPSKTYDLNDHSDFKMLKMELIQGNEYLEYNKTIMERGRELSINEGKWIFAEAPFGYDRYKLKNRKGYSLTPNDKAPIVKMMFEMFVEQDIGLQQIARKLNEMNIKTPKNKEWDFKGVKEILKRETYYGMITRNKRKKVQLMIDKKVVNMKVKNEDYTLVKGLHDGIITKEMFELAQQKMKNTSIAKVSDNKTLKNPLATILKCSECGKSMQRAVESKTRYRKPVRKYEINGDELASFLREHKEKKKLSYLEIANQLNISEATIFNWMKKIKNRYNHNSDLLTEKWNDLKKVLDIKSNKFDEIILTYEEKKDYESVYCKTLSCKCVASTLQTIEDAIISNLKAELSSFNYYVDNYEQEEKKMLINNKKHLKKIDAKIEKYQNALIKARRNYNEEEISKEEYQNDKKYYEEQLDQLFLERGKYENEEVKEIVVQYRKAIPILQNCIDNYYSLDAGERNELLKSFISHITYKKLRISKDKFDFDITLHLKI